MEQRQLYDREKLLKQLGSTAGAHRKPQDSTEGEGQGKDPQEERKPQNPYLQAKEQGQTETFKANVLKGIYQGASPFDLLHWALQAIDRPFFETAYKAIDAIYGTALADPGPPQGEIDAARDRLERIRAACVLEPDKEYRSIMERSIEAHEALIARLAGQEEQTEPKGQKMQALRFDTESGEFVPCTN